MPDVKIAYIKLADKVDEFFRRVPYEKIVPQIKKKDKK